MAGDETAVSLPRRGPYNLLHSTEGDDVLAKSAAIAADPAALSPTGFGGARLGVYLELAKAKLSALVLVSTVVGFLLASGVAIDWFGLAWTVIGTGLAAFGANALNQCFEAPRDARMRRTRGRPIPSRRLTPARAYLAALGMALLGPLLLWLTVNTLAAALALSTIILYLGAYTPLKVRSPANTLVGAVVGAIPPMIGWAAADGTLGAGAWLLAAILFFWQIPHFLALAWLYRDDYARGGFRMLPHVDQRGGLTCDIVVLYSLALLPLALTITVIGLAGWLYASGSLALGSGLVLAAMHLHKHRRDVDAKRVFLASVIYLPLLLGLMVADRQTRPTIALDRHTGTVTAWTSGGDAIRASDLDLIQSVTP